MRRREDLGKRVRGVVDGGRGHLRDTDGRVVRGCCPCTLGTARMYTTGGAEETSGELGLQVRSEWADTERDRWIYRRSPESRKDWKSSTVSKTPRPTDGSTVSVSPSEGSIARRLSEMMGRGVALAGLSWGRTLGSISASNLYSR